MRLGCATARRRGPAPSGGPSPKPAAWTAGPGAEALTVRDGHLVGRATSDVPVIDLERPPSEDRDVVHEVQVRMRASAGANLSVALRPTEKVDLKAEADLVPIIPWPFTRICLKRAPAVSTSASICARRGFQRT